MITLEGMSSPNVSKIAIMLEECALPYRMVHVDVAGGEQFSEAFLRKSPNNKVPCIEDDETGVSLGESGAILIYLAEKTGKFLPPSGNARAQTLYWLMVQLTSIGPNFGQLVHFCHRAPESFGYSLDRFHTEMRRCLRVLETRLAAVEYLAGEYSIADISTYPWLRTAESFLPPPRRPDLALYPAIAAWMARIAARPAVVRAEAAIAELRSRDVAAFGRASPEQLERFSGRGPAVRV